MASGSTRSTPTSLNGAGNARRGSVADIFCGAGGLSHGFRLEGYKVVAGVDIDEACRHAFETNNEAPLIRKDIGDLACSEIADEFVRGEPAILVGCAPCQPFSRYSQRREYPRWSLLSDFSRIILEIRPDVVSMENVPRLEKFADGSVFERFVDSLKDGGYHVNWWNVFCPDYGVPQSRSRLVLLASRHGPMPELKKTHDPADYVTVRRAIGRLPKLAAGGVDPFDPLHRSCRLSSTNLRRIRASRPGGTWRDWPDPLISNCHRKASGKSYSSIYGRMSWSRVAPTVTTQFYGYGNGRFGHPEQDRALSLREGAVLQTFPQEYSFAAPEEKIHAKTLGRLIGNAVPVELGRAIARSISEHVREHDL